MVLLSAPVLRLAFFGLYSLEYGCARDLFVLVVAVVAAVVVAVVIAAVIIAFVIAVVIAVVLMIH